jgi:hypothetical protein
MDNWLNAKNKPNQTQFKANSDPTPKMLINPYIRALYTQKPPPGGPKNKPNSNPIANWSQNNISSLFTSKYDKSRRRRARKRTHSKPIAGALNNTGFAE